MVQVDEVKNIMSDNIEKVLSRGEKLDLLVDKTDNLMFEVRRTQDMACGCPWDSNSAALMLGIRTGPDAAAAVGQE